MASLEDRGLIHPLTKERVVFKKEPVYLYAVTFTLQRLSSTKVEKGEIHVRARNGDNAHQQARKKLRFLSEFGTVSTTAAALIFRLDLTHDLTLDYRFQGRCVCPWCQQQRTNNT